MRVLLSAFAFSPYKGSEAAVGWNIARELARLHDVTVLTGAVRDGENDWNRYLTENGSVDGLTVEFVNPTGLVKLFDRVHQLPGLWSLYYLAYRLWQREAFKRAKCLHKMRRFDVIHQLTMIGYREPGYLWKLDDVPFVWGPVGGGPDEPIAFHSLYSFSAKVKVVVRNVLNWIQKRLLLRPRLAARHAKKIWVVTDADERMVHGLWGRECERMIETAATASPLGRVRTWDGVEPLRIVWSGTHTYGKALPILIHALAILKGNGLCNFVVDVLGKGGETIKWKNLAEKCGVADVFKWHGHLSHDVAIETMAKCHLLAFPSLKEGTPHVVLEALSLGLPVICHDICGMGTVVTASCGIKILMKSPSISIKGFVDAISNIMRCPELLEKLSSGALTRAKELSWTQKAHAISDAYALVRAKTDRQ